MIRFLDGPAEGVKLSLGRAPMFLRVVIDPGGNVDALEELEDRVRDGETAHVYQLAGDYGTGFACMRGQGCRAIAAYRLYAKQPSQDLLRDNKAWREWAIGEAAASA